MRNFFGLFLCLLFVIPLSSQCDLGGLEITSVYTNRTNDVSGIDTDGDGVAEATDEFVELCNTSTTDIDVSGWTLGDHSTGPGEYTFPAGTILEAGKCVVIVTDYSGTPPPCVIDLNGSPWISEASEVIYVSDGTDAIAIAWGGLDCADVPVATSCCEVWCTPDPLCVNLPNTTGDCADVNANCDYMPEALLPPALPVVISEFKINEEIGTVILNWTTVSEINNDYFSIEWSTNGSDFRSIGNIEAGSSRGDEYSFTHEDPSNGANYYRLNQIDFNGSSSLSGIRTISIKKEIEFRISSTVVQEYVEISGDHIDAIAIYSQSGNLIANSGATSKYTFDLSSYPEGIYIVQVISGNSSKSTRIMKI